MSNLLAMPLVQLDVSTGNNEDWIDGVKFVVDTGSGDESTFPQLDLRGITFEMEVRRAAGDPEVVLAATTANGTLWIGYPPNFGYLMFNILLPEMQTHPAGTYVGDIIGRDELNTRVIAQLNLTIVEGITKKPVNTRIVVQAA
jgi:hypothetical protein